MAAGACPLLLGCWDVKLAVRTGHRSGCEGQLLLGVVILKEVS